NRLFVVLLPAVILVEIAAAFPKVPQWLIWALRLLIAIGAARLLLHDSVYLKGTDSSGWSVAEATTWLVGLAVALRAVWLGVIGVGIVGLFGLLVVGRFFATLTTLHAGLLFLAPTAYWLVAFPRFDRFRPRLRATIAVALTAAVVGGAVVHAKHESEGDRAGSATSPDDTGIENPYE